MWSFFTKQSDVGCLSGPSFQVDVHHFRFIAVDRFAVSDLACKTQTFLNVDFPANKVTISDGPSDDVLAVLDTDDSFFSAIKMMKEIWATELWDFYFTEAQKSVIITGPKGFTIKARTGETVAKLDLYDAAGNIRSVTFQSATKTPTLFSGKFTSPITLCDLGHSICVKTSSTLKIILERDTSFNHVMKTVANYLPQIGE